MLSGQTIKRNQSHTHTLTQSKLKQPDRDKNKEEGTKIAMWQTDRDKVMFKIFITLKAAAAR